MTRLIVVRHGNSIGNFKRIFIGQTDWGLSDMGNLQVEKLTEYLKKFPQIDVIYSSDLSRAYNTVLPTAKLRGLEIKKRKGLRELYAGKWETNKIDYLVATFPEYTGNWKNNFPKTVPEGGEAISHLYYRIKKSLERIVKQNQGKTVLIATHATPIRVMNCIWNGDTLKNLQNYGWVSNASTSVVDYLDDGSVKIEEFGTDSYLEGIVTTVAQLLGESKS